MRVLQVGWHLTRENFANDKNLLADPFSMVSQLVLRILVVKRHFERLSIRPIDNCLIAIVWYHIVRRDVLYARELVTNDARH